jgi:hypothetical protein
MRAMRLRGREDIEERPGEPGTPRALGGRSPHVLTGVVPALALLSCALAQGGVILAPGGVSSEETAAPQWAGHLQAVQAALDRRNIGAAVQEWHQGYAAALRGRTWHGLIEVGDAYLRIAEIGALPGSAKPVARLLYLEALVQAKSQGSPEGALRAAAAFDRLGDRVVVEQCMRVAEASARRLRDVNALQQVAAARKRLVLRVSGPPDATRIGGR